jgi:hypothetical protein
MAGRIAYYGNTVTNGLVLSLDAAKRDSYPGSGTAWRDISGNGINGTLINGPTYNSQNGGSIVFDGVDDYASFGNNTSLDITETFTISLWINPVRNNVASYILDKDLDKYSIIIGYQSGFVNFYNGAYQPTATTTQISISNNVWTNIVYTKDFNSLSNNWKGYKNGSNVFTVTNSFTNSTSTNQLNLGTTRPGGLNLAYRGSIATTQIYNRALSAAEIAQNYNAVKSRYGL